MCPYTSWYSHSNSDIFRDSIHTSASPVHKHSCILGYLLVCPWYPGIYGVPGMVDLAVRTGNVVCVCVCGGGGGGGGG